MQNYKEVEGDLLDLFQKGEFDVIAHGCNCQKLMGAGIAFSIAKLYPQAYEVDRNDKRIPIEKLGDMSILHLSYKEQSKTIVNLYTQLMPGKDLCYPALELCLFKLNKLFSGKKVGLPLIGCGIAGGNWSYVQSVIKAYLVDCDVTIVHFKEKTKEVVKGDL